MSFVSPTNLKPLKIVVNPGNGAADAEFTRVHHAPDPTFPNGTPNPLLSENYSRKADRVREIGADCGVAFGGDFDRCFLFIKQATSCPANT